MAPAAPRSGLGAGAARGSTEWPAASRERSSGDACSVCHSLIQVRFAHNTLGCPGIVVVSNKYVLTYTTARLYMLREEKSLGMVQVSRTEKGSISPRCRYSRSRDRV